MDVPGPSTTSTVSASGLEAIETTIEVAPLAQISQVPLEVVYEVERTIREIENGRWSKICLQFPDDLLHDSVPVFQSLRRRLPEHIELYVMADTTYGSCCVDEVAAQHVDADFVVHYGHACLSAPARLPVLYIFPKAPLDVEAATRCLLSQLELETEILQSRKHLLLMCDVAYYHQLEQLHSNLQNANLVGKTVSRTRINVDGYLAPGGIPHKAEASSSVQQNSCKGTSGQACCQNGDQSCQSSATGEQTRQVPPPPPSTSSQNRESGRTRCISNDLPSDASFSEDVAIIYIGSESLALTNLLLTHGSTPVVSYDPKQDTARLESTRTNKMLMKRYGVVQKARDADVFGIVVGTLGVASYLPTLEYLRNLLKKHKKKAYTMAVGKLTPAKLGNFLEVEAWVLVACGENSLVEGYKDFLKPIITPWELEVALDERPWVIGGGEEGQYTLDFAKVLHDSVKDDVANTTDGTRMEEDAVPGVGEGEDVEGPIFSTVTGQYRYRRTYGGRKNVKDAADLSEKAQALALRNQESALASALSSAGGEFLAQRTYRGLDPRYGQDAPSVMEQGRTGIAREYGGDREAATGEAE